MGYKNIIIVLAFILLLFYYVKPAPQLHNIPTDGMQICFSDQYNLKDMVFQQLSKAKKQIRVAMFLLNDLELLDLLKQKNEEGTDVRLILDNVTLFLPMNPDTGYTNLKDYLDKNKLNYVTSWGSAYFHHKFVLIDGQSDGLLITGTFNWTVMSRNNYESLFLIKDKKSIQVFSKQFEQYFVDFSFNHYFYKFGLKEKGIF